MSNHDLIFLNYLAKVFDNLDDIIMLFEIREDDIEPLLVNDGFYTATNQPKGCIRDVIKVVDAHWTVTPSFPELFDRAISTQDTVSEQLSVQTPQETKIFTSKFIPVLNSLAEVTHLVVIARDITDIEFKDAKIAELEAQLGRQKKPKR